MEQVGSDMTTEQIVEFTELFKGTKGECPGDAQVDHEEGGGGLHYYIIERFGYLLVFHSINYRTHQKVTKMLNNIIARCNIKCRWHMSDYTHNKAYFFIKCHQTIRMIILKPFHDSQCC